MEKEKPKKTKKKKTATEGEGSGEKEHFRKPGPDEVGEYLSATQILKVISDHPVMRFSTETIGVAMKNAGFEYKRTNGKRGYRVVAYKPYEMEANRRDLAEVAKKEEEAGSDSSDTIF